MEEKEKLMNVDFRLKLFLILYILWIYNMREVDDMYVQVKAWGNSQGIRISKDILEEADIKMDEVLEVKVSKGRIILEKTFRHKTLEERAMDFEGKLNLDGEYDWGEPVGNEEWL
mgnify:FL=1